MSKGCTVDRNYTHNLALVINIIHSFVITLNWLITNLTGPVIFVQMLCSKKAILNISNLLNLVKSYYNRIRLLVILIYKNFIC